MDYTLRKATENDYEFCYQLTKQNMYDMFCRHWGGWVESEFRKGFIAGNVQIILTSEEQIGFISHKILEDSVFIDNIQVKSEYQRQGIGTKILKDFLVEYQDAFVRLTTFEDNPAKQLYERLAFKVYEKTGFTIKMEKQPVKPCSG